MSKHLPPLETLRFLEAAGRYRNFTQAAAELHVTPGAVSQRVKSLEDALGVRLFDRIGHEMILTEKGRILFTRVSVAMKEIAFGIESISPNDQTDVLSISLLPAVASRWLLLRLTDFNSKFPNLRIRLKAGPALASFGEDGVDVAIRFGAGAWPGLHAEKLFDEILFPVASPSFNGGEFPKRPTDFLNELLLQDERLPWSIWLRQVGLPTDHPITGMSFSDANLLLQEAATGRGIALARQALVADDLAHGRLIRINDTHADCDFAYFLVYPSHELPEKIRLFRDWLLDQAVRYEAEMRSMIRCKVAV